MTSWHPRITWKQDSSESFWSSPDTHYTIMAKGKVVRGVMRFRYQIMPGNRWEDTLQAAKARVEHLERKTPLVPKIVEREYTDAELDEWETMKNAIQGPYGPRTIHEYFSSK